MDSPQGVCPGVRGLFPGMSTSVRLQLLTLGVRRRAPLFPGPRAEPPPPWPQGSGAASRFEAASTSWPRHSHPFSWADPRLPAFPPSLGLS